jgi:polo-like kinase 1
MEHIDNGNKTNNNNTQIIVEEKLNSITGDTRIRKYIKGRQIGEGCLVKYYEFTCTDTNKISAVKVIPKSSLLTSRAKQELISEITLHRSLHHPHILGFEHSFEDTENVYILLEMCQHQSLNDLLKRRGRFTEIEVQCYIAQIIEALKYLHSHRIIHRNLKLSNLFLSDKMELKVGDFSLAAKLEFEGERRRTICGTAKCLAPEMLNGTTGHSYELDIWSLGVIMSMLIIGKPPFETDDIKTTYKRIKMNDFTFPGRSVISEAAQALITEMLNCDPFKRPNLSQILTHDFFKQTISIPKNVLKTSTLDSSPNLSYIRKFMPKVETNDIKTENLFTEKWAFDKKETNGNLNKSGIEMTRTNSIFNTNEDKAMLIRSKSLTTKTIKYISKNGMQNTPKLNKSETCLILLGIK